MSKITLILKWIKDYMIDIYVFFRGWFCFLLTKGTGNRCEDHKFGTILIGLVVLFFVSSGLYNYSGRVLKFILLHINSSVSPETSPANAQSSIKGIKVSPPDIQTTEDTERCDLGQGKWTRWYGNITRDYENKNHFILPTTSKGALFRYNGDLEDISSCEFAFIPRGEKSINYVISLDGIYQIVIGDNDMWTMTLKSTDSVDGDLAPVKESELGITRPRLNSKIKSGTKVSVFLNQKFISKDEYEVRAEITYKHDTSESDFETESFVWHFSPSPSISDFTNLSFGLIRAENDESEISAMFVYPTVENDEQ